jgi:predicted nucleic acid-binding protein
MDEQSDLPKIAVVDASYILAFLLPEKNSSSVDRILDAFCDGNMKLISSPLLPFEVLNGLRSAIIQKRIPEDTADALMKNFLRLSIPLVSIQYDDLYSLALKKSITVYDASYLWIAESKHIPLLTFDKILSRLSL